MEIKLLSAFLILALDQGLGSEFIDCPLVWVRKDSGEDYPEDAIPAAKYGHDYFLARTANNVVGYVVNGTCLAFDGTSTTPLKERSYSILTNPSGCTLNWIQGLQSTWDTPHLVRATEGSPNRVGRALSNVEMRILGGQVASVSGIHVALDSASGAMVGEFEMLQSYQKGLRAVVTDMKLLDGDLPLSAPKVVGIDQIVNRSPGKIRQTVEHKTQVESSNSFKVLDQNSWGHVTEIQVKTSNFGLGFENIYEFAFKEDVFFEEVEYSNETTLEQSTDTIIGSNITITVMPLTSIQLCSVSEIMEDFDVTFSANVRYSGFGLTAEQVQNILTKDGITGQAEDDEVVVVITGRFEGSSFTGTTFLSAPLDAIGPGSCYDLSDEIASFNRDREDGVFRDKEEMRERLQQIRESFASMIIVQ